MVDGWMQFQDILWFFFTDLCHLPLRRCQKISTTLINIINRKVRDPRFGGFVVISMMMMTIMTMMTVAAMMKITRRTMMIPLATTQERAPLDLPNWWSCAGRQTETWGLSSSWSLWWRWGKLRSENSDNDDQDDYEDGDYEEKVGLVSVVIWCFCNWRRE